jgi:hypothetical protein
MYTFGDYVEAYEGTTMVVRSAAFIAMYPVGN